MNITKAASIMGRKGGKVKSVARAEASRRNGRLGGRPKKVENSYGQTQAPKIISGT